MYVRRGLHNKRERERDKDREESLMAKLVITVSFYKLNNYILELRFQSDDFRVTSTYCMIACRLNEGHVCILFIDAKIQGAILL